ncbi:MAG: hypothetical protein ACTS2F_25065 [Thainema sp.]
MRQHTPYQLTFETVITLWGLSQSQQVALYRPKSFELFFWNLIDAIALFSLALVLIFGAKQCLTLDL